MDPMAVAVTQLRKITTFNPYAPLLFTTISLFVFQKSDFKLQKRRLEILRRRF